MAGNKIQIVATAKDEVSGPLAKMRDQFNVLGKTKGFQAVAQGVGIGVGITGLGLLTSGIGKVTGFLEDSVKAYNEAQASSAGLATSLKANVPAWDGNVKAIEGVISARMKLGFTDIEQRDSMARLVAATHDVNEALTIESTAMDLARFKHISLSDATDALTKVEAGSYRILKSLGIELAKGATQTEALAAVQAVASGQAADFAATNEGKLLVSMVKITAAEERFGKGLSDIQATVMPAAADQVSQFADDLDKAAVQWQKDTHTFDKALRDLAWPLANLGRDLRGLGFNIGDVGTSWDDATNSMMTATEHMKGNFASNFQTIVGSVAGAADAVQNLPIVMAADLRGGWDAVHSASVALGDALKKPIKAAAREKALMAILDGEGSIGRMLVKGLRSADPLAREAARKLYADTIAELDAFRAFKITISSQTSYGGRGVGQGAGGHHPSPPSHGGARKPQVASGTGDVHIHFDSAFPPSAQHKAEISRLVHDVLAPDRELASHSPG